MNSVHIIAPASYMQLNSEEKENIRVFFKQNAFKVLWGKNIQKNSTEYGATDAQKVEDLMNAFTKGDALVVALRGGYGSARLLDLIDWKKIQKSPSLFVGFSDLTAFQNAYFTKTGKPSISGFIAKDVSVKVPQKELALSFLLTQKGLGQEVQEARCFSKAKQKKSGLLIGGNLSCFESLIGTPYMPPLANKILLLEDVSEAPYRIDRMLTHLKNANVFRQVAGVVLGQFYRCENTDSQKKENIERTLKNFFKEFTIPVMEHRGYGHQPQHVCVPLGTKTTLDPKNRIIRIDGIKKKSYDNT